MVCTQGAAGAPALHLNLKADARPKTTHRMAVPTAQQSVEDCEHYSAVVDSPSFHSSPS